MKQGFRRFQNRKTRGRPDGSGARHAARSHPASPKPGKQNAPTKGPAILVEGVLQLKGNFGFVLSEDPQQGDVLITGPTLKLAMDGDRVRARVLSTAPATGAAPGRRSGEIVHVITHAHNTLVGTFRRQGNLPVVVPEDEGPLLHLTDLASFVPHVGDIVAARVTQWATLQKAAQGVLTEVLGPRDAAGVDLQILIRKHELPDAFPPEAVAEADHFGCTAASF